MSACPISDFFQAASPVASYDSSTEARGAPCENARLTRQRLLQDETPSGRPIASRETGVLPNALWGGETPTLPSPSTDARAARLEKFRWEQGIVEYLNRGVSVGEIAARIGYSEERMGAVVRDILARRMPASEDFAAIQASRLNEALLVAVSAMTDMNLRAVDRVIRIVRDLDRYHGFVAAARRLPEPSRLSAPADGAMPLGGAPVSRPELTAQEPEAKDHGDAGGFERPEDPPQAFENMESASRIAEDRSGGDDAAQKAAFASALLEPVEGGPALGAPGAKRPQSGPQAVKNFESAPGAGRVAQAAASAGAAAVNPTSPSPIRARPNLRAILSSGVLLPRGAGGGVGLGELELEQALAVLS